MVCIEIKELSKTVERKAQIDSEKYSMTFMITIRRRGDEKQMVMSLHGLDIDGNKDYNWFTKPLEIGSELGIKILETESNIDQEVDITQVEPISDKLKLKNYQMLKKELTEKGLI